MPKARITSIEPNPLHASDLRWVSRLVSNMHTLSIAVSDERGEADLYVPSWKGFPITGEASLSREAVLESDTLKAKLGRGMRTDAFAVAAMRVPVCRVDELGLAPRWVKIDVQGRADAVLRGSTATIERHQPVYLVESDGRTNAAVLAYFEDRGYTAHVYDELVDDLRPFEDQSPQNIFFLPPT